jgi:hypothetical protein
MIKQADLDNWFSDHPPAKSQIPKYARIRAAAMEFAKVLIAETPPCADQTATLRKLRETVASANMSIACNGFTVQIEKVANVLTIKAVHCEQTIALVEATEQELLAENRPVMETDRFRIFYTAAVEALERSRWPLELAEQTVTRALEASIANAVDTWGLTSSSSPVTV